LFNTFFQLFAESTYTFDKGHSYFGFEVERFMVGEVTGRFNDFDGSINLSDDNITSLKANRTIKGEIWFNEAKYPEI